MTWPNEDELCHFVPALYPTERIKTPAGRLLAALRRGDPDQEKNQEKIWLRIEHRMVDFRAWLCAICNQISGVWGKHATSLLMNLSEGHSECCEKEEGPELD